MLKRLSSIGLMVATIVTVSGSIMPVQAATVEELQAQIASLLAQITALQSQLGASTGGSTVPSTSFTRDLTLGSRGTDVTALQNFLMGQSASGWPAGQAATGYFGSVTKAALAKYQAAVGISPAAGYFGPKTRAYVASLGGGTTGGSTGGTGGVVVPAPSTGLAVSLAASNPAAGSLISSASTAAARVPVLSVNLTAGTSGGVTVNGLKFTKLGVISDTSISSAYLIESGKVVAQYSSLSNGVIAFSNMSLGVNAGQTRTFTLAIDPATGLSAGNTVAFQLKSASDVTAVDSANAAITPSGNFPLSGNTMTVTTVTSPAIASVTIASSSIGTSVYAGTTNVQVSQWTVTVNNNPVYLNSINYKVIGSAAKSDIRNVKLLVNGTQVGQTLASVGSDGSAYFDLTSSPVKLSTGSSNLQVYADIMGSPSFDFTFEILNSFDVYAVDSQYNVPVAVTVNGGTSAQLKITISAGSTTVTAASDTPTGNIAKGSSGVTLAKFNIYAAGEPLKVKFLDVKFATDASNSSSSLQNIYLVDDQGVQLGSTISTSPATDGALTGQCTISGVNQTCHFGTSSSNINYIIPANTTRTISVRSDILSTATGWTSLTVSLPSMSGQNNLTGQTSAQSASSGGATGGSLTLASNALTSASNGAVGTQTYAKGASNSRIGSYILTASAAEGVNISNLTITFSASSTNFQNAKIMVAGTQFGTTKNTLSGSDVVAFSGSSPIAIPAGGSKVVDVYADILSSADQVQNMTTVTQLTSCTGTGASTFSSISCPTAANGQAVAIAGSPTMTVAASSATAPSKQVVMGSTNNSLFTVRFTDTANIEPVKINKLILFASSTDATSTSWATVPGFANLNLYNGSTLLGGPVNASSAGSGLWAYTFNFTTAPQVPQNGTLELELKGDVASFASGGAQSNKIYSFKFNSTTTDITALGAASNNSLTGTAITKSSPVGNTITTLRTKLSLSSSVLGATSGRTRSAVDDVANLVISADSGYNATVNTITLKLQGQAVSNTTVNLIDPNTGTDWSGGSAATCTWASSSCTASFSFVSPNIPTISAGTSKTLKIRVDSSNFANAANSSDSMTILVPATTSVNWGDGSTTAGLNLESTIVPITVANVSYE